MSLLRRLRWRQVPALPDQRWPMTTSPRLQNDPANVVMPTITYTGWNYSTLDQITLDNVADLQVAWTWQVGILDTPRGFAARRR